MIIGTIFAVGTCKRGGVVSTSSVCLFTSQNLHEQQQITKELDCVRAQDNQELAMATVFLALMCTLSYVSTTSAHIQRRR